MGIMAQNVKELPKVISHSRLCSGEGGRECEVCNLDMKEHDWALMDPNGSVIFCSNLTFVDGDRPEVLVHEHYDDGEDPEIYNFGAPSLNNLGRLMATSVQNAERLLDRKDGPKRVEVFARRKFIFDGPKIASAKLGDWNEQA